MAKVDMFLEALIHYDKENIHPDVIKAIQPYLKDVEFEPGKILEAYFVLQSSNWANITLIFRVRKVKIGCCGRSLRMGNQHHQVL